jgi:hypothetical protein
MIPAAKQRVRATVSTHAVEPRSAASGSERSASHLFFSIREIGMVSGAAIASLFIACSSVWAGNDDHAGITDYAKQLGVQAIGEAYDTPEGVSVCLQGTDGLWFNWNPARPIEHITGTTNCQPQPDWKPRRGLTTYGPSSATFARATSIEFHSLGNSHCEVMFPTYYTAQYSDGTVEGFRVFQHLKTPIEYEREPECDAANGRGIAFAMQFNETRPLYSAAIGTEASLLYARGHVPVLLLITRLPKTLWTDGSILVMSTATFDSTIANLVGPDARYKAIVELFSQHGSPANQSATSAKSHAQE